jgi:hypothetical protein
VKDPADMLRELEHAAFEQGYLIGALAFAEGDLDLSMTQRDLMAAAEGASAEYLARLQP